MTKWEDNIILLDDNSLKKSSSWNDIYKKKSLTRILIPIILVSLLNASYLYFAWSRYQKTAATDAITLGQSLESFIHSNHIEELTGNPEDLKKDTYIMIKRNLSQLIQKTDTIQFAYILAEKGDEIVILVDSEPPTSPDYSPPGQIYKEADDIYREPFKNGKPILTGQTEDRWGKWKSVLVPIKSADNDKIIAVFGIDYPIADWNAHLYKQMVSDVIITIFLDMLILLLYYIWSQHILMKRLNKKLKYDEALYHSVFNQAPIGIAIVSDKSFILRSEYGDMNINKIFEQILSRRSDELAEIKWPELTHPDDLQADLEKFEQFKAGRNNGYSIEKRFIKPDGTSIWTNMTVSPLIGYPENQSPPDRKNRPQSLHLCLLEDISDRKNIEESLKESERSKSVLLSHLPGLAYKCNYDRDWTMQFVSDGCLELTGYPAESLMLNKELSYNDLITSEYRELLWEEWKIAIAEKRPFKYEYEIETATGERKWVLEMGEGISNGDGQVEFLEGIVIDISDRKAIENALKYNIEHDKWTNLFNRNYLENVLINDTKNANASKKRALIGINLSTLQSLTIAYGFDYTQELIKKAANDLSILCDEKKSLFNTYDNRFVFYIKDYKNKNELREFCETITGILQNLFRAERINGGIGVVEIGKNEAFDADYLLKKLLIASETAINISENEFAICFYDMEMEEKIIRKEDIKHDLFRIASGEKTDILKLQFQPILDLKTNRISGLEALARLNNEKYGAIPPMEFIPIAEETKLIVPIGHEIICKTFKFINMLKSCGYSDINVSINISVIQLLKHDFIDMLKEAIKEMKINAGIVCFEITESVFAINYDEINNIIGKIKKTGIQIAIDDFGTGYSSLARERELNVNCLKIDKYFINKLTEVGFDKAITSDIISMAHKLGHCVIAEGVEKEEQKQYLIKSGCDKIQGFLVSEPLDEDNVVGFLKG